MAQRISKTACTIWLKLSGNLNTDPRKRSRSAACSRKFVFGRYLHNSKMGLQKCLSCARLCVRYFLVLKMTPFESPASELYNGVGQRSQLLKLAKPSSEKVCSARCFRLPLARQIARPKFISKTAFTFGLKLSGKVNQRIADRSRKSSGLRKFYFWPTVRLSAKNRKFGLVTAGT